MRMTSEQFAHLVTMLNKDRDGLVNELIDATDERAANILRGRIQQIDDIIRGYPKRLKDD